MFDRTARPDAKPLTAQPFVSIDALAALSALLDVALKDRAGEVLCERWVENPYYQLFCGKEFFPHRLVFDRSSLTRWRNRMGEERLQTLLQESLSVATRTKAIKPPELSRGDRPHLGSAQEHDDPH